MRKSSGRTITRRTIVASRLAQPAPGRGGAQCRDQRQPALGQRAGARVERSAARPRNRLRPALPSLAACDRAARAGGKARQQARRHGRPRRFEHSFLQLARRLCLRSDCSSVGGAGSELSAIRLRRASASRAARAPARRRVPGLRPSVSLAPRNAASARAARRANSGARSEATPSAAAIPVSVGIADAARLDLRQPHARLRKLVRREQRRLDIAQSDVVEIDPISQAFNQRGRRRFVLAALVQRDDADARGNAAIGRRAAARPRRDQARRRVAPPSRRVIRSAIATAMTPPSAAASTPASATDFA